MDKDARYEVRDISKAEQGSKNIDFAEQSMGALLAIRDRFAKQKPLDGIRVGLALHITKETAALVRTLAAGGAHVMISGCNPLSTQDDVAAAIAVEGFSVWGYKGESKEDYYRYLNNIARAQPQVIIDDGCDLVSLIHAQYASQLTSMIGGCEETTTGVSRLRAMHSDGALRIPMIAVNDNKTKHLLDNYYGTGQSTLDGILRSTNMLIAGKSVVVCGYGPCGKGVALRARGLGANVTVTEVDAFRALQAHYDGFGVAPFAAAARYGDVFITVTGNKQVIGVDEIKLMKSGAVLANSGHFDCEVDLSRLSEIADSKRSIRENLDEYVLDRKRLFVCGQGRLVNLAAAEGHPSEVMATSFCGQTLAVEYLVKNKLDCGVHTLPEELDNHIARLQLEALNLQIDRLTNEQKRYLKSWNEGT